MGQRAIWTLLGLIGVVLAGGGAEILRLGLPVEDFALIGGGAVAIILGIIMAFFGFKVLLTTQREKKG